MKPQELMTAKQVRTYVGCAPTPLRRLCVKGVFPLLPSSSAANDGEKRTWTSTLSERSRSHKQGEWVHERESVVQTKNARGIEAFRADTSRIFVRGVHYG